MKKEPADFNNVSILPALLTRDIPRHWEDYNGHVNIQYYLRLVEQSGWSMFEEIGLGRSVFQRTQAGFV